MAERAQVAAVEKKSKQLSRVQRWIRDLCASLIWLYAICKLVVFDIDRYLSELLLPEFTYILNFKLFFFLGLTAVVWLILGTKKFTRLIVYVLTFPGILFFWRLPKLFMKNWTSAIVIIPVIYEIVTAFRTVFISYTLFILSAVCILLTTDPVFLYLSMLILAVFLARSLYSSFQTAYSSTVFSSLGALISKIRKKFQESTFWDDILKNIKNDSEDKAYAQRLSLVYMFHEAAAFANDKVSEVFRTRKVDLYLIVSWFWTVCLTTLVFSFAYLAIYKIDRAAFLGLSEPTFLSFLGFSFGKLTPSSISTIVPLSMSAKLISYLELLCSLVIFVILVFTILTAAREKYKAEVETLIYEVAEIASVIQCSLEKMFNVALADAETILLNDNASLINNIRKLRGLPALSLPPQNQGGAVLKNKSSPPHPGEMASPEGEQSTKKPDDKT